ncbi:hypothetical protein MHYP_G00365780 [Metynnis hypsauchen]
MAQGPRSTPGFLGSVPRSVRFQWRNTEAGDAFPDRVPFIREVLFGALGLGTQDLVCAQRNNAARFFDVAMSSEEAYQRVLERGVDVSGHPLGRGFDLYPLGHNGRRMVTVHLFNPFVTAEAVRTFLRRYGEVQPGETMVRDELGIWNGRRQFMMEFREDGKGGLTHPPAYFSLDGNKGYLFYRGQPAFCRGCLQHGHDVSGCKDLICKNCLGQGHQARDCKNPRRCKSCGGEGHLAHSCPRREVTYATVLAGAGGGPVVPRTVGEEGPTGIGAQGSTELGAPAAAIATSSPGAAEGPAPGPHPLAGKEAPPISRPAKRARKRRRAQDEEMEKRQRAGYPLAAPEGAPLSPPVPPKLEDTSVLVGEGTPPPATDLARFPQPPGPGRRIPGSASRTTAASPRFGMAQGPRSTPGFLGSVPRSVRFQWRNTEAGDAFPDRVPFIREVLFGALGLGTQDLVCAQRNNAARFFDVAMSSEEAYQRVLERGVDVSGHPLGRGFDLYPLGHNGRRMVTVHLFNPFVTAEAVRTFLRRYGEVQPGETMVRDELGIWNGRRQFMMEFREDGKGGLTHPPAYFSLDGNKGYLFYRGQPAFCRGCLQHGHDVSGCKDLICKNCLGQGHQARDCKNPRRCKSCGGEGHLAHSCPRREVTYATVLAGAGGGPVVPRTVGEEGPTGIGAQGSTELGAPAAAIATSSPGAAEGPAPGPHPLAGKEAPPISRPAKRARKRRRAQDEEMEKRQRAGYPLAAPEGAPLSPPVPPKLEDTSVLVGEGTPPPPLTYGGKEVPPQRSRIFRWTRKRWG